VIQIYEDLFKRYLPEDGTKQRDAITIAENILSWIFVSVRPLHRDDVILLGTEYFNQDRARTIDVLCRSFISESEDHVIKIAHSSVRDYLAVKLSGRLEEFSKGVANSAQISSLDEKKPHN
jgi:hypothetical protein